MGRTKYITPKFTRSKISDVKATLYLYFHFLLCECLYNFSSHCYDPRKSYKYCIIWSLESQPSKAKCKPLSTTALFWCSVLLLWGHLGSDETGGKLKVLFATEMTRERTVYQEKKLKFLSWPTFGASILPKAAWSCLLPMKDRTNNPLCTSGCGCALGVPALLPEPSSLVSLSWLPELLHSILAHLVNSVGF